MSTKTLTIKDAEGNYVGGTHFQHNTFPELDDLISSAPLAEAIRKTGVTFEKGVEYRIYIC